MGYVVSRNTYKLKSFYTWVIFIPMIFNGGMLAGYVVNTNILHLRNSIWALILPLAVSPFNIVICKTFFKTTIPDSIVESAKIDGAGQLRIFAQIILPISKPIIATIALFAAFGYWNDWFQASLYISDKNLQTLQSMLNNIQNNIEYIANNPYGGLSLQQYKASMPTECENGDRYYYRGSYCMCISIFPEVFYFRSDHRLCKRMIPCKQNKRYQI